MKIFPMTIFLLAIGCPSSSVSENSDTECREETLFITYTKEYNLVCGCDSNTYGNSCVAKASGINSFTNEECDS